MRADSLPLHHDLIEVRHEAFDGTLDGGICCLNLLILVHRFPLYKAAHGRGQVRAALSRTWVVLTSEISVRYLPPRERFAQKAMVLRLVMARPRFCRRSRNCSCSRSRMRARHPVNNSLDFFGVRTSCCRDVLS